MCSSFFLGLYVFTESFSFLHFIHKKQIGRPKPISGDIRSKCRDKEIIREWCEALFSAVYSKTSLRKFCDIPCFYTTKVKFVFVCGSGTLFSRMPLGILPPPITVLQYSKRTCTSLAGCQSVVARRGRCYAGGISSTADAAGRHGTNSSASATTAALKLAGQCAPQHDARVGVLFE